MAISTICKGTVVARRDQPAQLGIVAHVVRGVIMFVFWHGRAPSYEHARDLVVQSNGSGGNKKPRSKPGRVGQRRLQ